MSIHAPGPRLLASSPFSFMRSLGRGKKKVDATIALIPFIDFLTVVVVFLLMSFSASGEGPLTAELPSALHGEALEAAPIVTVDGTSVSIDGRRMAATADLAQGASIERVEALVQDLETQRANWPMLHPHQAFEGRVIVQASRDVDFRVLRKVLFSVSQAGYGGVSLAVRDASG